MSLLAVLRRHRLAPLLAAVLVLTLGGLWWSGTRGQASARSAAVDQAWAEVESAYRPRLEAVPALTGALQRPSTERVTAAYEQAMRASAIDDRVRALSTLERELRMLRTEALTDRALAEAPAYRVFALTYAATASRIDLAVARFDGAVESYLAIADRWPSRIVMGLGDARRPLFGAELPAE